MPLLADSLQVAAWMWQHEMKDWPTEQLERFCHEHADVVAYGGDALIFGGTNKKEKQRCRDTFNVLAKGLAAMSLLNAGFDLDEWLKTLAQHEREFFGD